MKKPEWLQEYERAYPVKSDLQIKIEKETDIIQQITELRAEIAALKKELPK